MRNGEDTPAADAGTPPASSAWADYQGPLMPGRYPPLGYGPDGAAIYQAGTPPQAPARGPVGGGPDGGGPGGPGGGGPGGPSDPGRPTPEPPGGKKPGGGSTAVVLGLAGVVVIAALLIGVSLVRNSSSSQSDSTQNLPEYEPTVVEPPSVNVPGNPGLPNGPGQTQAPGQPGPGSPGAGGSAGSAAGKPVSYDATISGTATILYVDDQGLRTEFAPQHTWHVDFTGGSGPLRMIVLAGGGSAATCTITVDGKVVASDRVSADSPQRTASCFA